MIILIELLIRRFQIAVIFKVYDIDSKGRVTFKDLLEVLRDLTGSFMSEEQREVLMLYTQFKFFLVYCIVFSRIV